jgi:hypothetical protein
VVRPVVGSLEECLGEGLLVVGNLSVVRLAEVDNLLVSDWREKKKMEKVE